MMFSNLLNSSRFFRIGMFSLSTGFFESLFANQFHGLITGISVPVFICKIMQNFCRFETYRSMQEVLDA